MPVLADTESLRDLLRPSSPEAVATDGTSSVDESLNTGQTSSVDATEEFVKAWRRKQKEATEILMSRFGDLDVLVVAKVLSAMTPEDCRRRIHHNCCLPRWMSLTKEVKWACLTALYPTLSHSLDEFAGRVERLGESFGENCMGDTYHRLFSSPMSWKYWVKKGFRISPLDPQWHDRKFTVKEGLEDLEQIGVKTQQELKHVDVIFDEYLRPVQENIVEIQKELRRFLLELDWREDNLDEAIERGARMDPPQYEQKKSIYDPDHPPNPYRDQWDLERYGRPSKPPEPAAEKKSFGLRFHLWRADAKHRLGSTRVMATIMSVFCVAGLTANILAVYKCIPSNELPVIDSNFWSALSQTNIGVAAIYSVIIPQLQSGESPVPEERRWLFKSFLVLSVLTALLATAVYPWHGRTSIVAAFISALTQLAVTLQMILSSGQKIQNLEMDIANLRGR